MKDEDESINASCAVTFIMDERGFHVISGYKNGAMANEVALDLYGALVTQVGLNGVGNGCQDSGREYLFQMVEEIIKQVREQDEDDVLPYNPESE